MIDLDELIAEADRAYEDIFNVARRERDLIRRLVDALESVRAERDAYVEALQRVREQHQPRMNSMSALYPEPLCSCQSLYPCPTIKALEGDE